MDRTAKVTGLSPLEGPPGTKITIRGENLGLSQNDLIGLTICGEDCLMYAEWCSSSKIFARSRSTSGKGDVVVTTASGGKGTCTVQFRGYYEPIGPTVESAVWVDESSFTSVSYGHPRATSPSQLHPDDPLGLSDEGNISKFPQEDLHELFPASSGNLLAESFSPAWYLLENHHGTTFLDLKAGLSSLRRKVTQHKEGPLSFLKSNVMAIMDCLEILSTLQVWLVKDKQELGNDLIDKLEETITKSQKEANDIFEDVLARKDRTDSMRNALSVLQRFRFLFNLPANLEKNIQQGDYDIVINDYARAKFLFQNIEVAVFKKVYQEVEQRIEKFRTMLFDRLMNLPLNVEEQKRLVRHLVNLESSGNPAWEAVLNMYRWLLHRLNACKDNHLGQATVPSVPMGSGNNGGDLVTDSPEVVQFVEDACEIFEENFPEFWKLGQAYFSGDMLVRENAEKSEKITLSKQESYQSMTLDLTTRLSNLIRAGLLPHTLQQYNVSLQQAHSLGQWPKTKVDLLGPWLPYCIRFVRQCFSTLMKLDLPEEILNVVQLLLLDLRIHSMSSLFAQATEDVLNLHTRETWLLEMDDYSGATTQLPLLFESRVVETMQLIKENVLQCGPKETQVFSQIHVQASMKQLSQSLIHAFAQALDKLATTAQQEHKNENSVPASQVTFEEMESESTLNPDQKLLIVLSNCNYTCKSVVPRLQESFLKHGYPDMGLVIKASETRFRDLERKLFDAYQSQKCGPVVGMMEPNMYVGKFSWKNCLKPSGTSIYVKEAIMSMIAVHAEVTALCPPSTAPVMTKVVEAAVEEMARLYGCVRKFTRFGNMQATLDLRSFEETISSFSTTSTSKNFMVCRSHLEPFSDVKDRELVENQFRQFKNQMKLQLLCFREEPVIVV